MIFFQELPRLITFYYETRPDVRRMEMTETIQQEAGDKEGEGKYVNHFYSLITVKYSVSHKHV